MGPEVKSVSTSGRTVDPEADEGPPCDGDPFCRPAGIENPTTDDVGRRVFEDDAAASDDCSNDAQDFFGPGAAGFTGGDGVDSIF